MEPVPRDRGWEEQPGYLTVQQVQDRANPFSVIGPVHAYRLHVSSFVNNTEAKNYLHYTENDKLDVIYNIEDRGSSANDSRLLNEYIDTQKRSAC